MITLSQLAFQLNGKQLLHPMDFTFEKGKSYAIIGPNGAGKSTLLSLLSGQQKNYQGSLIVTHQELREVTTEKRANLISYMPQNEEQNIPFTVEEYIRLGQGISSPVKDLKSTESILAEVNLANKQGQGISTLSGGEFRLAALARVIHQQTPIVLLDELDQGLDIANQNHVFELILKHARQHSLTLIAVVHDINAASAWFDELLLLSKGGQLLASGKPTQVLTKANLDTLFMADIFIDDSLNSDHPVILGFGSQSETTDQLAGRTIHLLCGGGSGKAIMNALFNHGATITTGVLNLGDSDWKTANRLGIECVTANPFSPILEEQQEHNQRLMKKAEQIVIVGCPYGKGNLLNLQDAKNLQSTENKQIIIVNKQDFADYCDGEATLIWQALLKTARVIDSIEHL
jgi:iron complex transport system ATP-binding protein